MFGQFGDPFLNLLDLGQFTTLMRIGLFQDENDNRDEDTVENAEDDSKKNEGRHDGPTAQEPIKSSIFSLRVSGVKGLTT